MVYKLYENKIRVIILNIFINSYIRPGIVWYLEVDNFVRSNTILLLYTLVIIQGDKASILTSFLSFISSNH